MHCVTFPTLSWAYTVLTEAREEIYVGISRNKYNNFPLAKNTATYISNELIKRLRMSADYMRLLINSVINTIVVVIVVIQCYVISDLIFCET